MERKIKGSYPEERANFDLWRPGSRDDEVHNPEQKDGDNRHLSHTAPDQCDDEITNWEVYKMLSNKIESGTMFW